MKLARLTSFCLVASTALMAIAAAGCSSGSPGKAGADGQPGARGADGPSAEAPEASVAINLVEPRVGLLARRLEVTISTDGKVDLTDATVDFGDGVEVLKVEPRGPALVATIEIAPDAKLGKHDVVLEAGGKTLTAKHGFVVAVHLDAKVGAGKAEQGGLVRLDVSNRDKIWFDTENFTLFPLAGQKDPSLVGLAYQGFTATDGSVVFLGDPLAKTGALGFLGFNNPNDENSPAFFTEMDAVTVAARKPVELMAGTPIEATFDKELQTGFYVADLQPNAKEGLLVEAWAHVPNDSTMSPMILAYPQSGTVADLLDQGVNDPGFPMFGIPATEARVAYPVTAATKAYFVVVDSGLAHGPSTKTTLSYNTVRAQIFAEKPEAHATAETAQNIGSLPGAATTIPGRVINGELKDEGEIDVYKFTGLSPTNVTDMLVTVISDSNVVVRVDTAPTFDSENLVEITQGGKAGMGVTSSFVGQNRFIQVMAAPDSNKPKGKYTLGIKRLAPAVPQR